MANSGDAPPAEPETSLPIINGVHAVEPTEKPKSHFSIVVISAIDQITPPELVMEIKSILKQQEPAMLRTLVMNLILWLIPIVTTVYLTIKSCLAVYEARDDPWTMGFLCSVYANLLVLLWCLRAFDRTPAEHTQRRKRLRAAVWVLATTMQLTVACRIIQLMPFASSLGIWCFMAFVTAASFWWFFICPEKGAKNGDRVDAKHCCSASVMV